MNVVAVEVVMEMMPVRSMRVLVSLVVGQQERVLLTVQLSLAILKRPLLEELEAAVVVPVVEERVQRLLEEALVGVGVVQCTSLHWELFH